MSGYRLSDFQNALLRRLAGVFPMRADGRSFRPPQWLVLCVNNFCNLHCKMCDVGLDERQTVFYANLVGNHPQNMSLELLRTILDQARSFRPLPRVGLAFTEPLLHPQVVEMCREAKSRGFTTTVTTNGYRLSPLAEALVGTGLDKITVSVDGSEEVHDRVRGKKGSFARLYQGIENLNQARSRAGKTRPDVEISYTITDESATDMIRFVRQVEPLAPSSLVFSHWNFITADMALAHNRIYGGEIPVARSNMGDMDPSRLDLDSLWKTLDEVKDYLHAGRRARWTLVPDFETREDLEIYYRQPLAFVGGRTCTDPWQMMMVQTDGTVIPAHGRCYNVPVGRVTETPLSEIWNGARLRGFRSTLKGAGGSLPACSRCCGIIGKPKNR